MIKSSSSHSSPAPRPLPGPRGLPFLGQGLRYQRDPLQFFLWMREGYGDLCEDKDSAFKVAYLFSPESIEHVLVRNSKNYLKDRILKDWDLVFGEGLLLTEGENWKKDRRVINPAFSRTRVAEYGERMLKQSELCAASLRSSRLPAKIEITSAMTELTLRIALDTLFGRSSLSELDEQDYAEVRTALKEIADWFEFSSGAWMAITLLLPSLPYPKKKRYTEAVRQLDHLLARIIARKRLEIRKNENQESDLLAALIAASDPEATHSENVFSDRQVRDHALTFFLAGHETTALALTYTLRLLAEHPAIQDDLRTDLQTSGTDSEFLGQVIDESLRLFPPASVTAREAIQEDSIQGYRLRAGTTAVIPIWAIHRDSRYFGEDVDTFRPARWTADFKKKLPRSVYLPFGFGPRMCIGFGFAIQEMRIVLAELLRHHRFRLPTGARPLELQASITMRPRGPVWLDVSAAEDVRT